MEDLSAIINKMNELFVSVRYKYIKQNEDIGYITYNALKQQKHVYLNDRFLELHLKQKSTYGIFCRKTHSKFITFDVDVPQINEAKKVVLALYDSLNSIGIPSNKIFTSWSGTKGFHVDIYFSKEIPYFYMERLFNATVNSAHNLLGGNIPGEIEKRPSPSQGLKLPLGTNLKNKNINDNICWYVDILNGFTPIKSLEYILSIDPMDAEILMDLIKDIPEQNNKFNYIESQKEDMIRDLASLDLSLETPNSIATLYQTGLSKIGTRNSSLCKLAIYFNTLKVNKKECEQRLLEWMTQQDSEYYKTSLDVCYREITRIVNAVYKNNIVLSEGKNEISVSKSELLTTYQYPKKFHSVLNALLLHTKRYGDIDKEFYMTYQQIAAAAQCSIRTAINHIALLEHLNLINVKRMKKDHLPESHPNTYSLKLEWLALESDIATKVPIDKLESYWDIRIDLIKKTFTKTEWGQISILVRRAKELTTITEQLN